MNALPLQGSRHHSNNSSAIPLDYGLMGLSARQFRLAGLVVLCGIQNKDPHHALSLRQRTSEPELRSSRGESPKAETQQTQA